MPIDPVIGFDARVARSSHYFTLFREFDKWRRQIALADLEIRLAVALDSFQFFQLLFSAFPIGFRFSPQYSNQ
jgi:hypothetical protein